MRPLSLVVQPGNVMWTVIDQSGGRAGGSGWSWRGLGGGVAIGTRPATARHHPRRHKPGRRPCRNLVNRTPQHPPLLIPKS
jgi:hypothetical protein